MIIECPHCSAKVDAKVIATYESGREEEPFPTKTHLLACPSCTNAIIAMQHTIWDGVDEFSWSQVQRVWPKPEVRTTGHVPEIVKSSLDEAYKCFNAQAYGACAVMCGRALEGVCNHFKTKNQYLAGGLTQLLEMKVIDSRLYEWGDTLRQHRNIGAHAGTETISEEDARDLFTFVNAICEYIFVLSERFKEFIRRRRANQSSLPANGG
jgi:hypothetical protein